jgi:hypothetical protein
VRAAAVAADAERDDVGMLDKQERIGDPARTPIFNERALQRQRLAVRHQSQASHIDVALDLSDVALQGPRDI